MPDPFISATPKASEGGGLAAVQTPRQTQPGRSEDFSSVFDQRMREQEAPPSRTTAQGSAAREERAPEQQGHGASGRADSAEQPGNASASDREAAESAARSTNSGSPAAAQPGTEAIIVSEAGQTHQPEAAQPASLAVIASIIAAMDRSLPPTGTPGTDIDIDDATLDTPGRRAQGFLFARLPGNGAKAANEGIPAAITNGTEKAIAPKGGQSRATASVLPTTTIAAQIQAAASHSARFAATPAAPLPSASAEMPVAGLSSTGLVAALRGDPGPIPQLQVHTPAGQRAWAEDVGSRMLWMVGRGESRAELVLTPPSLGRLGVSIQINGDQTSAHFVAATAAAREALEQAMPRLREALQQAGITLGQTNVSTSGEQQARGDGHDEQTGNGGRIGHLQFDADAPLAPLPGQRWAGTGTGVIDTFA